MFEEFRRYRGKDSGPNRFWPVKESEILRAEARIGVRFPQTLRSFFEESGCGFYSQGTDDKEWNRSLINRLVSPDGIADLMCDEVNNTRPPEGFCDGEMPFFDTGERTYLVIYPKASTPERVYWSGGLIVAAEDLEEFYSKLSIHAGFYVDALQQVDFDELKRQISEQETQ